MKHSSVIFVFLIVTSAVVQFCLVDRLWSQVTIADLNDPCVGQDHSRTEARLFVADDVVLNDSGQALGDCRAFGLALGDLDGDRDLDVFVACYISDSQVFMNDGKGVFSNSGQRLGGYGGHGVALGDLDGDGDLDAFVAFNDSRNPFDKVFLNDGTGIFSDSGQRLGSANDSDLTIWLSDIDGDNVIELGKGRRNSSMRVPA